MIGPDKGWALKTKKKNLIRNGPNRISDSTIEYRSIGSTDEDLQDWLALSRRAWRELRQKRQSNRQRHRWLFMSSQASLSYF